MIDEKLRKSLTSYGEDLDIEINILDDPDFDNSIIGVTSEGRLIYDYSKMIEELAEDEEMEFDEAQEFIDYNTIRSLPYMDNGPIICDLSREELLDKYSK